MQFCLAETVCSIVMHMLSLAPLTINSPITDFNISVYYFACYTIQRHCSFITSSSVSNFDQGFLCKADVVTHRQIHPGEAWGLSRDPHTTEGAEAAAMACKAAASSMLWKQMQPLLFFRSSSRCTTKKA